MQKPSNVTPITTRPGVMRDTGEVVDVEFPATPRRAKRRRRKVFALMDLDALKQLQLTGAEWSVLHCIMRATDPENNQAPITVQQIAADCEMAEPNVSRIMRELRGRRVVTTLRRGIQKVNPHIMHRGQIDDWNTATDHELEPIWSRST